MDLLKTGMLVCFLCFLAFSCKKKEETPVLDATTEEAATLIATTFCTDNAGVMTQIEDAAKMADATSLKACLYDSSFSITSLPGATITYQYQVLYSYGFVTPNNYQLSYISNGSYNAPYVTANMQASGTMNVTGFFSGDAYLVNGSSERVGTFSMKTGNHNGISGEVSSTLTNFRFDRNTLICESGTAIVTISGTTNAGRSFSFSGTLVYQGNYTASLTLSGKTYTINIATGMVSN